ncbi:flagellar basal-body protein FlbY [Hirschia litorea]|uniref:Flagellar basal-body protein FlbY n=1 Tax=Hirschia litorea TaxID=1199156 RepID=A0ABW2IKX5_9PROT
MAIAAHDGADRADQLIAITQRLSTLISEEIVAHQENRLDATSQDWAEKEKLAHAYRIEIANIRANPTLLAEASQAQKEELKNTVEAFRELSERHANALLASKEVTEGLVRALTEEVATSRAAPAGYGRAGTVAQPKSSAAHSGIATNLKV